MSAKILIVAIAVLSTIASSKSQQAPPAPQQAGAPTGGDAQPANQPGNGATAVVPGQAGSGQVASPSPITKIISPPSNAGPAAQGSRPSGPAEPAGSVRSKRQAGIPPVCCTKDPCDPCATTPCIACPLCG